MVQEFEVARQNSQMRQEHGLGNLQVSENEYTMAALLEEIVETVSG